MKSLKKTEWLLGIALLCIAALSTFLVYKLRSSQDTAPEASPAANTE